MTALFDDPHQPLTTEQIATWVDATSRQRVALHRIATEPFSRRRQHALTEMSNLLKDALDAVRKLSAQLREDSHSSHQHAVLQAHTTCLPVRHAQLAAQRLPSSQDVHDTARGLRDMLTPVHQQDEEQSGTSSSHAHAPPETLGPS
jgi:hypothetical protein